jgi:hypothetical protein
MASTPVPVPVAKQGGQEGPGRSISMMRAAGRPG